jgi:hypothetical protein
MTIIFSGTIGQSGLGGQAWASLQYLIGLRELGHDVVYLEDSGEEAMSYNWEKEEWVDDIQYPSGYVHRCLEPFGLGKQWHYKGGNQDAGMSSEEFAESCAKADLMIIRAIPLWVWRKEYTLPRRRIFIDVDPGFTQVNIAAGDEGLAEGIRRCERFFTYGQNVGDADSTIPTEGWSWIKTLPPIAISQWPVTAGAATHFTSILRWDHGFQNAEYKGAKYGQKDLEFPKFFSLPKRTKQAFRVAINGPLLPPEYGWESVSGEIATQTPFSYREFIQHSRAEFGVAKHGYVKMRSGWFSDRSVCYLASGKPVLVQETGVAGKVPLGAGMITFTELDDAVAAVEKINADYDGHCRAARQLAESFFATDKVLPALLAAALD